MGKIHQINGMWMGLLNTLMFPCFSRYQCSRYDLFQLYNIISSFAGIKMNSETVSDSVTVSNNGQTESKTASGLVRNAHLVHLIPSFDSTYLFPGLTGNSQTVVPRYREMPWETTGYKYRGTTDWLFSKKPWNKC